MSTSGSLDPSAFILEGGPVGVLLIYGFTASPTQMRLIGDDLYQHGLTVVAPLLPVMGQPLLISANSAGRTGRSTLTLPSPT